MAERLINVVPIHIRSFVAFLAIVGAVPVSAVILDPPEVRCASVNIGGDVTLTWVVPSDPGGDFFEYRIYGSIALGGPYALVGSVGVYGQTTFFHAGAGAQTGPRYYYATTVSTSAPPNESISSDTLSTIFVEVGQSTPMGNAVITWNAPTVLPSSQTISVYLEYPLGNWILLADLPPDATSYQHVVSVCEAFLNFRVGLNDELGCVSFSSRDGEIFEDVTPPSSPIMTTVSVDTITGLATMEWAPSPEGDTDGYILLTVTPGGGVIIDTVFGQFNNFYQWSASTADLGAEAFTVAAFDTCLVGTPPSPNTSATLPEHTTIHLTNSYDQCGGQVFLTWSPYGGWEVGSYQVLVQVDGGLWSVVATVAGSQTSYLHTVQPERQYCYVIKAVSLDPTVSSLSNKSCRYSDHSAIPQFNYLRTVTVVGPEAIMIVDSTDTGAYVTGLTLERSVNGASWQPIASAPAGAGPVITWVDNDVDPSTNAYRYRVHVYDSCGSFAVTSNIGGNIILHGRSELDNYNYLDWNTYADWAGEILEYRIHRRVANEAMEQIAQVPAPDIEYADDVAAFIESTGRFCYYVEAVESGNPSGINATSASNEICVVQEDLVYIPNAFIVGGINSIFIPVIGYVDVQGYELNIINRWGQIIWTTNDRYEGWDGTLGSQVMPTGLYAYYCTFHNGAGRRFEERGTVMLLTAEGN
jgi:gliding motility-associated-like protein